MRLHKLGMCMAALAFSLAAGSIATIPAAGATGTAAVTVVHGIPNTPVDVYANGKKILPGLRSRRSPATTTGEDRTADSSSSHHGPTTPWPTSPGNESSAGQFSAASSDLDYRELAPGPPRTASAASWRIPSLPLSAMAPVGGELSALQSPDAAAAAGISASPRTGQPLRRTGDELQAGRLPLELIVIGDAEWIIEQSLI